jgi:hypothetical protein
LVSAGLLSQAGQAATITSFSDGFESELAGTPSLNYSAFSNFNVTIGTVDLVSTPQFGITCAGPGATCVDLDGSQNQAGTLQTKDQFAAGNYTLSFDISGNQRGGSADVLTVSLGSYSQLFTLNPSDPFQTIFADVLVPSLSFLTFSLQGSDNVGIILDNVAVRAVPGPLAGAGLVPLLGLGILAMRRRKKLAA